MAALIPHYESDLRRDKWDHATLVQYIQAFRWLLRRWDIRHLMRTEDCEGINDNIDL